jgi:hypothetical protein
MCLFISYDARILTIDQYPRTVSVSAKHREKFSNTRADLAEVAKFEPAGAFGTTWLTRLYGS